MRSSATGVSARLAPCAPSTIAVVIGRAARAVAACRPAASRRAGNPTRGSLPCAAAAIRRAGCRPASAPGPHFVDPGPGDAALISATARDRSGVDRNADFRGVGKQHQRNAIGRRRAGDRLRRSVCARDHESRVAHAVGAIEQHARCRARRPAQPPDPIRAGTAARRRVTISAIAASRSASSSQSRMRRRCTDSYGILRRNISDGNSTTDLRSFCVRWISTGTASAARPRQEQWRQERHGAVTSSSPAAARIDRNRNNA